MGERAQRWEGAAALEVVREAPEPCPPPSRIQRDGPPERRMPSPWRGGPPTRVREAAPCRAPPPHLGLRRPLCLVLPSGPAKEEHSPSSPAKGRGAASVALGRVLTRDVGGEQILRVHHAHGKPCQLLSGGIAYLTGAL